MTLCNILLIHNDDYEVVLKCDAVYIGRKGPTFQRESSTMKTEAADLSGKLLCIC